MKNIIEQKIARTVDDLLSPLCADPEGLSVAVTETITSFEVDVKPSWIDFSRILGRKRSHYIAMINIIKAMTMGKHVHYTIHNPINPLCPPRSDTKSVMPNADGRCTEIMEDLCDSIDGLLECKVVPVSGQDCLKLEVTVERNTIKEDLVVPLTSGIETIMFSIGKTFGRRIIMVFRYADEN